MTQGKAQTIVNALNEILKSKPLAEAVMDDKYDQLVGQINRSGDWGVLATDMRKVRGKIWCGLKLVRTDDPEYKAIVQA